MRAALATSCAALVVVGAGCFDLDSFVWNPRNCATVDKEGFDCVEKGMCSACDERLPFEQFGIPDADVEQTPIAISGGETMDAYFIRSSGARPDDIVVYHHGNFGGIEHYLNRLDFLYRTGVNIFAVDYRGFGKSSTPAEPDEPTFMDDVSSTQKALDPLLGEDARVTLYGYSAGALGAIEQGRLAAPCGLVLEAPFPSVQSFSDDSSFVGIPQSFVTSGSWDNIAKMPDVHAPLLQLHGKEDDFIRVEVGRQVFEAANEPKELFEIDDAGHGNGGRDITTVLGDAYVDRIGEFLDGLECE